jgi:hypothetical protein
MTPATQWRFHALFLATGMLGAMALLAWPWPVLAGEVPQVTRYQLTNGLNVTIIQIANEPLVSCFTFLPGGLSADAPGHGLWSRLNERLTTQTSKNSDGGAAIDRVQLETWSRAGTWEQTLREHARLLGEASFTRGQLETYRDDTLIGMGTLQPELQAHAYVEAVFLRSQRFRLSDHRLSQDALAATPETFAAWRHAHWPILQGARLCIISPLPAEQVKLKVEELFGSLVSAPPDETQDQLALRSGEMELNWGRGFEYVVLAWPLPELDDADEARLLLAGDLLAAMFNRTRADQPQPEKLHLPGIVRCYGHAFFLMTLSLSQFESADQGSQSLLGLVGNLCEGTADFEKLPDIKRGWGSTLALATVPPILADLKPGSGDPATVFLKWFQVRRTWSWLEYAYGARRHSIAKHIDSASAAEVAATAKKYLSNDKATICKVRPLAEPAAAGKK